MRRAAQMGQDWQRDEAPCTLASSAGVRIIPAFAATFAACVLPVAQLLQDSQQTLGAHHGPGNTLQAALTMRC